MAPSWTRTATAACPGAGSITTVWPGSKLRTSAVTSAIDSTARPLIDCDQIVDVHARARGRGVVGHVDDHRPERGVDPVDPERSVLRDSGRVELSCDRDGDVDRDRVGGRAAVHVAEDDAGDRRRPSRRARRRPSPRCSRRRSPRGRWCVGPRSLDDHRVVRRGHAAAHPRRLRGRGSARRAATPSRPSAARGRRGARPERSAPSSRSRSTRSVTRSRPATRAVCWRPSEVTTLTVVAVPTTRVLVSNWRAVADADARAAAGSLRVGRDAP